MPLGDFVTPWHPMQQISGAAFRKRTFHPLAGVAVLQIIAELGTGPAARAAIETAEELVRVGGTPFVAARGGPMVSELQARGGIFVRIPTLSSNPLELAFGIGRLVRLIRAEAIEIVHARSSLSAWVALGAARLTRTAFVTSFPAGLETGNALVSRFNSVMARGDRILVDWACSARTVERLHPESKGKTHVVGPGIDCSAFAAENIPPARVRTLRQRWNSSPDEPIVLFLGELEPSQPRAMLATTARLLHRSGYKRLRLVHMEAGSGSRSCTIDPEAESPRSIPRCDDLPAAFLTASVVAVPSGRDATICRLAVAAQAMGTPLVVADEGALRETVVAPPDSTDSLRTGWRITPGEPEELAAAIAAGLGLGASARDRLSTRARAHVARDLSAQRMRAETLRAFIAARGGEDDP